MKTDYLKTIIKILERSEIDSIQLSSFWGMNKIKLFKTPISSSNISQENIKSTTQKIEIENNDLPIKSKINEISEKPTNKPELNEEELKTTSSVHYITAPLVGTFYVSPKPGEPEFIKIGDKIKSGQIICIIEAMKIFNEIESDVSGTIIEILVNDSNPVEYGQKIIAVKIDD